MNRPSHWLVAFFVVLGGVLWWGGQLERIVEAQPAPATADPTSTSVVVRRPARAEPRPTYSVMVGRVIDRLGWPVVGAEITVPGQDGVRAVSDADGRFEITVAGAIHRTLRVEARGRHEAEQVRGSLDELVVVMQDAAPWARERDVLRRFDGDGLLIGEGFVKDVAGSSVARARVVVRGTPAGVLSDPVGRYTIPLPTGPSSVVAFDTNGRVAASAPMSHARNQGKVPLPDLVLRDGITLRGRLVDDDGAPCGGATLVLDNDGVTRRSSTDESGGFAIAGLIAGDSHLTVLPHAGHLSLERRLAIDADTDLGDLVFERASQVPMRLTVVDGEHRPIAHAHVVAEQTSWRRAYGQANEFGQVCLAGLGSGPIEFEVRSDESKPLAVVGWDAVERELVVSP